MTLRVSCRHRETPSGKEPPRASLQEGASEVYEHIPVFLFVTEEVGRLGEDAVGLVKKIAPRLVDERVVAMKELYHTVGDDVAHGHQRGFGRDEVELTRDKE